MDAETNDSKGFIIEGEEYEIPVFTELTIDEWMIAHKFAGLVISDIIPIKDDADAEMERVKKFTQPGALKALAFIAYKRSHPRKTDPTIGALVGGLNYLEMLETMVDEEEDHDAADPTEETPQPSPEPEPSSPTRNDSPSESGSSDSATSSETPEVALLPTGMSG